MWFLSTASPLNLKLPLITRTHTYSLYLHYYDVRALFRQNETHHGLNLCFYLYICAYLWY